MKLVRWATLLTALGLCMIALGRPERNSFLNRTAHSPKQLANMVRYDPVVRDRYARHFAMSPSEVYTYLSSLKLARTTEDTIFTVYAAPDSGELRSKLLRVKKGTKVWTDDTGDVVLLWHCGNPVTRGPKSPTALNETEANPVGTVEEQLVDVPLDEPASMYERGVASIVEPGVPGVPTVVTPGESDITLTPPIGGGGNLGWLGVLPGLFLVTGGGSSNPIPEPGTLVALGAGSVVLFRRRKRA